MIIYANPTGVTMPEFVRLLHLLAILSLTWTLSACSGASSAPSSGDGETALAEQLTTRDCPRQVKLLGFKKTNGWEEKELSGYAIDFASEIEVLKNAPSIKYCYNGDVGFFDVSAHRQLKRGDRVNIIGTMLFKKTEKGWKVAAIRIDESPKGTKVMNSAADKKPGDEQATSPTSSTATDRKRAPDVRDILSELMLAARQCQSTISEVYNSGAYAPGPNKWGCESTQTSKYIASVATDAAGRVTVTSSDDANLPADAQRRTITFAPTTTSGTELTAWAPKTLVGGFKCAPGTMPAKYVKDSCGFIPTPPPQVGVTK